MPINILLRTPARKYTDLMRRQLANSHKHYHGLWAQWTGNKKISKESRLHVVTIHEGVTRKMLQLGFDVKMVDSLDDTLSKKLKEQELEKVWSPEAREAAAAARRGGEEAAYSSPNTAEEGEKFLTQIQRAGKELPFKVSHDPSLPGEQAAKVQGWLGEMPESHVKVAKLGRVKLTSADQDGPSGLYTEYSGIATIVAFGAVGGKITPFSAGETKGAILHEFAHSVMAGVSYKTRDRLMPVLTRNHGITRYSTYCQSKSETFAESYKMFSLSKRSREKIFNERPDLYKAMHQLFVTGK